eukprot:gene18581-biopygen15656
MARRYEENEAIPAVQENIRENARPQRTIVDIQTFSGKDEEDIAEWLIRWEVAANANNWTPQQQLTMMPVYLTRRAGRLFWRFPENVRNSLEELKDSLDETFNTEEKRYLARQKLHEIKQGSKESVIEFSERVDKLVMKGHDGLDSAAQKDRIASECFIKGLRQEIKETVWEKCPNSFQEAVQSAERREVFLNSVGKRSAGVNEVSEDLIGLIQKFNSDRERNDFKFDLLLGDKFVREENFVIDYREKVLRTHGVEVGFEPLPSECVATLNSVVELPVGTPLRVRADLSGNHCGLVLFGERQLVKTDEHVLVAPVVTKADDDNSVLLELVNTTRSKVSLQPGTNVMHLQPFDAIVDDSVQTMVEGQQNTAEVPIGDFKLEHLSDDEQAELLRVLERHHVWPTSEKLGTTHLVEHPIDVQGAQPVRQRPYRVPETKRKIIAQEVQKMLLSEVIQPSASLWSSPVVLIEKPNGEYRFCVDYRRLNAVTKKDAYPLPRIDETLDALGNAKVFTTIDLQSGFWQIPMKQEDREKTAFATHNGHYSFNVMPFGLANAPATFQRLMDLVLSGLHWTHCLVYLDDVIVFAPTVEEHLKRLDVVLDRIEKAGLTLKPAKCQWLRRSVKFLGHIVSEEGVTVDPAKVSSVKNFPIPQNKTDVRSFLGLTGYYRRFIADYASRSKPLVDLTKKKRLFQWTKDADDVFQELKDCLISAPVLQCPDFSLQFKLYTDACDYGLGAVLAQETDDGEAVIAYASRILKPSEAKYAVLQKEALGIVWALKYFYPYLYGRHFTIVTDHRPLKWLKTMDAPNNLFARWISEIQGYDFDVIHRPGKLHGNADALSRCPVQDDLLAVATSDVIQLQKQNEYAGKWIVFLSEGGLPSDKDVANKMVKEKESFVVGDDGMLYRKCKTKTGHARRQLVVPKLQIGQILMRMHDHQLSGHPGFFRTYRKVQQKYFWPKMKSDIKRHIRHCEECAKFKSPKPAGKTPLKSIVTSRPLQIVAMDFVGPLPKSDRGNTYALVMVDHFSRWPVVYSVDNIELKLSL